MPSTAKRLNYYDHQFLRAPDFTDEQNYHVSMRRLHNAYLHTWGIMQGLEVTAASGGTGTAVTVNAGVALDSKGQEIILANDTNLELGGEAANTTLFITIAYDEQQSDPTTEAGGPGNTRITEMPKLTFSKTAPADASMTLILARVPRTGTGLGPVDGSDRRQAGVALGSDIAVNTLTLKKDGVAANSLPVLSCTAANQANLANAGLTVSASIGIGAAASRNLSITGSGTTGTYANIRNGSHEVLLGVDTGAVLSATTASDLQIRTNDTPRVVVQANSGNVGIGTAAPASKLHIRSDASATLGPVLTLMNGGASAGAGAALDFSGYDTTGQAPAFRIQSLDDGNFSSHLTFSYKQPGANNGPLVEAMRITSNGSLGLGLPDPDRRFTVFQSGVNFGVYTNVKNSNHEILVGVDNTAIVSAMTASDLQLRTNNVTRAVIAADTGVLTTTAAVQLGNSDIYFTRTDHNHTGIGNQLGFAAIENDGAQYGGLMILGRTVRTNPLLRIVKMWDRFEMNGDAFKPGGGAWGSLSDKKLKKNIGRLEGVLDKLLKLRGVQFEWKDPEQFANQTGQQMGLVAQEVEQVFPEWVGEDLEGTKTVSVRGFEALVVEAIRELRQEIKDVKDALEELRSARGSEVADQAASATTKNPSRKPAEPRK